MSKIVFFDIDGTLLDDQKKLPHSTKQAIKELQQAGVRVALATGRAPFMFKNLMNDLEIDTFVSFNGQYVVCENEIIFKNPLNRDQLEFLQEEANKQLHPMVFLDQLVMKANHSGHEHIRLSMESLKFEHPQYDPEYFRNNEIYQALLYCGQNEEEHYAQNFSNFNFIRWHDVSTDVLPRGGSKAIGIQHLLERIGVKQEHVIAFGDGLNDKEMLQFVGTGIAMGNAKQEVQQVADIVTSSVSEDGIVQGLKSLGLLK